MEKYKTRGLTQVENIEIQLLLEGIYKLYGFDFRNYVLPSISRRIRHRIQAESLITISGLQEKVFHDSACRQRLIADFSIQVTEMFRDPEVFNSFRNTVVPILRNFPSIRIWHAGCSTGEEVYSMAILLLEEGLYDKTLLYATDMNEEALEKAKSGVFHLTKMKKYTCNYLQAGGRQSFSKYYKVYGDSCSVVFHDFLKKKMVFAQHNLVTDSSINEFNVIICRNVMIYFNKNLQNRVYELFSNSLNSSGFLVLGKKEDIKFSIHENKYEEVDAEQRIYRKIGGTVPNYGK